jgi:hypothetical protein
VSAALRVRVVAVLAVFGALAAAASYVFGAPVSVALLVPAIALVAVVTLSLGLRVAAVIAVIAAAGFLYVQLAGVNEPLVVDFGSGSATIDLPTLVRGAAATWLPTLLGVAALLIMLPVAGLLRHSLDASRFTEPAYQTVPNGGVAVLRAAEVAGSRAVDQAPPPPPPPVVLAVDPTQLGGDGHDLDAFPLAVLRAAHEAGFRPVSESSSSPASTRVVLDDDRARDSEAMRSLPRVASFVRVTLGPNPDGKRVPRVTGKRLAEMVGAELGELQETAVVKRDEAGEVLMLLLGADDRRAHSLVHRLEDKARTEFRRSLESVVLALEAPGQTAEQPETSDLEIHLEGRPIGTRVSSHESRGGS